MQKRWIVSIWRVVTLMRDCVKSIIKNGLPALGAVTIRPFLTVLFSITILGGPYQRTGQQ